MSTDQQFADCRLSMASQRILHLERSRRIAAEAEVDALRAKLVAIGKEE